MKHCGTSGGTGSGTRSGNRGGICCGTSGNSSGGTSGVTSGTRGGTRDDTIVMLVIFRHCTWLYLARSAICATFLLVVGFEFVLVKFPS